jgi:type VI protein secretion system component VasK
MVTYPRRINFFEVVLLIVGISVGLIGFFMINNLYQLEQELSWGLFSAIFLWLILIIMIVLAAAMEDVKEELEIVIREHMKETKTIKEETRVLKEINHSQLQEFRSLREDMSKKLKKK